MGGVRIYVWLVVAVVLSGLAAIVPFAWSGADVLSSSYRTSTARELESNARLFALAVRPEQIEQALPELVELTRAAKRENAIRYTIIRDDGTVLADSEEDASRMENHRSRPEILAALAGETGIATRISPTLGTEWTYVAVPLGDGGVIRTAASMDGLQARLSQWWEKAFVRFLGSLAILLVMALLVARKISRPVESAASMAERYAAGDLSHRLPVTGPAELRRLASSMGVMAGELETRFKLVNRQREEMRVIFENMSEGILAVDDSGQILLLNSAAQTLLTLPDSESGNSIDAVSRNADLLDAIRQTTAENSPLEREIRIRQNDNKELLVQAHTVRINQDGEAMGVLVVLRDITRMRQLEIMRRDFVANVSHELRTPITTIQSCLETLLDEELNESNSEFAAMALRNAKRMGAIIDNLLFLAGMESGRGNDAHSIGRHPVGPIVDEAVSLCREEARARNTAITVQTENDLTALVNPQLIVHALVNLLDNAIKYGPDGGTITISAARDTDRVRLTVSDHGPGIAPRHQSRVFERFYRVDGVTRVKKGSGLGLAIVKHIALSQGGDIQVESEIGAGSTFTLSVPC